MKIPLGQVTLCISEKTLAFFGALLVFLCSLYVYPYFDGGDQLHYRKFYKEVVGLSFMDAFFLYRNALGTLEPVYFFIVYICSPFISKDILFSLLNLVFSYLVFFWMLLNRVRLSIIFLLSFNFYFMVLLFSAERLKLSLLLLLVGLACHGLWRFLFFGVAFFAHVQILMLLIVAQSKKVAIIMLGFWRGKISIEVAYLCFGICIICGIVFIMRAHVLSKLSYYLGSGGFMSVIKPSIFCCLAVFYARGSRLQAVLASTPFLVFAFFVGDERVTIFSYFVFLYFALKFNGGFNTGVVFSGLYFLWGGLRFLYAIFESGDGFNSSVTAASLRALLMDDIG